MRAIARPIPDEPPVTSAARSIWVCLSGRATPGEPRTDISEGCRLGFFWCSSLSPKKAAASAAVFVPWVQVATSLTRASPREAAAPRRYSAVAARGAPQGLRPRRGGEPARSAHLARGTTRRSTSSTTSARSSSPSTSSRRSFDDPAAFGRIAATNALNDVFAMGGTPLLALSIAAFPEELPTEVTRLGLRGRGGAGGGCGRDPRRLAIRFATPSRKYGLRRRRHGCNRTASGRRAARAAGGRALPHEAARHRPRAGGARQAARLGH